MIPARIRIALWVVGTFGLLVGIGFSAKWAHDSIYEQGRARGRVESETGRLAEREELLRAAEQARTDAQDERERRAREHKEIVDDADRKILAAAGARAGADAAADRLRQRVAALAARCSRPSGDPAAAASSPPAGAPGDLLADMSDRVTAAARQLADVAHDRLIAGETCQRSYLSLPGPKEHHHADDP